MKTCLGEDRSSILGLQMKIGLFTSFVKAWVNGLPGGCEGVLLGHGGARRRLKDRKANSWRTVKDFFRSYYENLPVPTEKTEIVGKFPKHLAHKARELSHQLGETTKKLRSPRKKNQKGGAYPEKYSRD